MVALVQGTGRVSGIDLGRAIASLIMIQGHAYHAWVAADERGTAAFQATRLLGTLPLPAFLLLAGASLAWRVRVAAARHESAREVRQGLIRRGLEIVGIGYLVNLLSVAMDGGQGLDTLLRADVLHVIGWSIAALAWIGVREEHGERGPSTRLLLRRALFAGTATVLLCVPLTRLAPFLAVGPLRYVLAPFVEVAGVTQMPFVPLFGWASAGVGAAWLLARARDAVPSSRAVRAGGAPVTLVVGAIVTLATIAFLASAGATSLVARLGGVFDRTHPAVILNVVDLAARGALVLAAGIAIAPLVRRMPRIEAGLLRLGRGSLVAYVFHVPFCYGALGESLRGRLTMHEATIGVAALVTASYLAVLARDQLRDYVARPGDEAAA